MPLSLLSQGKGTTMWSGKGWALGANQFSLMPTSLGSKANSQTPFKLSHCVRSKSGRGCSGLGTNSAPEAFPHTVKMLAIAVTKIHLRNIVLNHLIQPKAHFLRLKDDAKIFSGVNGTVECGVWCGVLSAMFGEIAVGQESDPPKITHQSLFAARRRFWLGKSLTLPVSRHLVLRSSFRFVLSLVPCPLPHVPSIRSDDDWWLCCSDLLFNLPLPTFN